LNFEIDGSSRFELKYRLNYFQYYKIRNTIQPYMVKDTFTKGSNSNKYLVRSLYFDTYDYRAYYEKLNGNSERVKFRLRSYHKDFNERSFIRVELKIRQGNRVIKRSVFVPIVEYQHFMANRHWQEIKDPITNEFERNLLREDLRPVVLIEYDREGYQTRLNSNLRITFDHHIRSVHAKSLFPTQSFFQMHYPKNVILEIKFKDNLPLWLEKLVRNQGLKFIANSKYTQGLQIARHDLYYPDQVILVR
jgi:SPX domain protein involved in polyphosphate accumulation